MFQFRLNMEVFVFVSLLSLSSLKNNVHACHTTTFGVARLVGGTRISSVVSKSLKRYTHQQKQMLPGRLLFMLLAGGVAIAAKQFTPLIGPSGKAAGALRPRNLRPEALTPHWGSFLAFTYLNSATTQWGRQLADFVLQKYCVPR